MRDDPAGTITPEQLAWMQKYELALRPLRKLDLSLYLHHRLDRLGYAHIAEPYRHRYR